MSRAGLTPPLPGPDHLPRLMRDPERLLAEALAAWVRLHLIAPRPDIAAAVGRLEAAMGAEVVHVLGQWTIRLNGVSGTGRSLRAALSDWLDQWGAETGVKI